MGDPIDTQLRSSIVGFVKSELAPDRDDVNIDTDPLLESGLIDSVGIIKLVSFLEKECAIKISDDELLPEYFETVDAIHRFVRQKQEA